MELWVRSQDKECLIKTNIVEIEYFGENSFTSINTRFDGRNASLGLYKTKERALEVLDEIQEYINNNCEFIERKTHTKMGTYTNKIETYVYEMPKE